MKASTKSIFWNSLAFLTQLYLVVMAYLEGGIFISILRQSSSEIDSAIKNYQWFDKFALPVLILFPILSIVGIIYGVLAVSREGFSFRSAAGFLIYFFLPAILILGSIFGQHSV